MPLKFFAALLVFLGLGAVPLQARDLQVEVEVLHIGGMLAPGELDAMLAGERLGIEAVYHPTRLIDGVTARRERIMPIGSRLFAISRYLSLPSGQIGRQDRLLRFQLPGSHPEHLEYYRLNSFELRVPAVSAEGRREPDLRIGLMRPPPESGARETALFLRLGDFDLGLRLRYRWSDARDAMMADAPACSADVESLGNGQYRFRPRHRLAGLYRALASTVQSDPPSRPPAGQRSLRLREPYPEPVTGWKLSRNHLVQLERGGQSVERFSIYAEQPGAGSCRRTHGYEALYAGGQIVAVERYYNEFGCSDDGNSRGERVEAQWLDDGSLARYLASTPQGSKSWDGFLATTAARCEKGDAPPADEVEALKAELRRFREAFLRP